MPHLAYLDFDNRERFVPLDPGSPEVVIGRNPDCAISVNLASISRRHAKVYLDRASGRCAVADLGSANGVKVNGNAVQSQVLQHGDTLLFGGFRVVYYEAVPTAGQQAGQGTASHLQPAAAQATVSFAVPTGEQPAVPAQGAQAAPAPIGGPGPAAGVSVSSAGTAAPQPAAPADPSQLADRVRTLEAELGSALRQLAERPAPEAFQQLRSQVTQLESENQQLRQGLAAVTTERDTLRANQPDPQIFESLHRELSTAKAQVQELDAALNRAMEVLGVTTL
jgi:hypothetical protein